MGHRQVLKDEKQLIQAATLGRSRLLGQKSDSNIGTTYRRTTRCEFMYYRHNTRAGAASDNSFICRDREGVWLAGWLHNLRSKGSYQAGCKCALDRRTYIARKAAKKEMK